MSVQVEAICDRLPHYIAQVASHQDVVRGSSSAQRDEPDVPTLYLGAIGQSLQGLFRDVNALADQFASATASSMGYSIRWYAEAATFVVNRFERLKSSTATVERPEEVDAKIRSLLQAPRDQTFEAGMESEFSRALVRIVTKYGDDAIGALADCIGGEAVSPEVAAEALQWLAHINDHVAYRQRLLLLERSLSSSSPWVRDGAGLGLALLEDPRAIPSVARAIDQETIPELRDDLQLVLTQLENARNATASEEGPKA